MARAGESVCKTRSRRRNFCDQQGIGEYPNKPLLAKWIARSIACWYNVIDEIKIISSQTVIWLCRFLKQKNIEVLTEAKNNKIAELPFRNY